MGAGRVYHFHLSWFWEPVVTTHYIICCFLFYDECQPALRCKTITYYLQVSTRELLAWIINDIIMCVLLTQYIYISIFKFDHYCQFYIVNAKWKVVAIQAPSCWLKYENWTFMSLLIYFWTRELEHRAEVENCGRCAGEHQA